MRHQAFSLVEMLVAMAVFSAIAVVMATILSNVGGLGQRDESRVAAVTAFRTATDRMSTDWSSSALHPSHPPAFEKLAGNDRFYFFSHVRTPRVAGAAPRLARVSYRVKPGEMLIREIEPVDWDDLLTAPKLPGGAAPFEEECGRGIFRMEIAFQDRKGNLSASPPASPSDLKTLVVAFAALDPELMERMTQVEREALEGLLPDVGDHEVPGANWSLDAFTGQAGYVREKVRFYQRWFPFQ